MQTLRLRMERATAMSEREAIVLREDLRFDESVEPLPRPSTLEVDAILGRPIRVLDHGFVRLVDYMGNDAAIVQAARVSYGLGTRKASEDKALIRYLLRNRHTSPFEMIEVKLHVKAPIFVARQWLRHRTSCLAGDTILSFDLPGADKRGKRSHHGMTIEKLYRLWHEGTTHSIPKRKPLFLERVSVDRRYTVPELARLVERREESLRSLVQSGHLAAVHEKGRIFIYGSAWHTWAQTHCLARAPMRDRLRKMQLRMCDEATGEIRHTQVVDIWQTGVKPVFEVTLDNGKSLKMTKDHRCLTERGWMTLEQATQVTLCKSGGVTRNGDAPAFATNGVPAYQSAEWLAARKAAGWSVAQMAAEAGVSYYTIRKWLRKCGTQFTPGEKARLSSQTQRGQRRTSAKKRVFTERELAATRAARSGSRSNFWKGGITPERVNIGRWTSEQATKAHLRKNYCCVICGGKDELATHHVDPVWHNEARARDITNLTTLCGRCHTDLHRFNLELAFLADAEAGETLTTFWERHPVPAPHPEGRKRPRTMRLFRHWAKVVRIEYAGEEMTYDLAVAGPYHNFVANGLIVHNSVNELSARYSILPDELYLPDDTQISFQSTDNKQGRSVVEVDPAIRARVRELLLAGQQSAYATYQELLDAGIARELARIALPVAVYSEWYWKINLHNLFHFLELRTDPHAQFEIRLYGEAICLIARRVAPVAYEAFEDYVRDAVRLSRIERDLVSRALRGEALGPDDWKRLGKRERAEFARKFGLDPDTPAAGSASPATPTAQSAPSSNGHTPAQD